MGTVAQLRGYRGGWLVWVVGLPLAAAVGVMRMGADKHYLSDVLVGAAVGSAFGFALPRLFHGRVDRASAPDAVRLRLVPAPGGLALTGAF